MRQVFPLAGLAVVRFKLAAFCRSLRLPVAQQANGFGSVGGFGAFGFMKRGLRLEQAGAAVLPLGLQLRLGRRVFGRIRSWRS